MSKEAYVWWNSNICHVISVDEHITLATSVNFRRATRKARNLGYAVRVYKGDYAKAPRDAVHVTLGSYVLPAAKGSRFLKPLAVAS